MDLGAFDNLQYDCAAYLGYSENCSDETAKMFGHYDDTDFTAADMCCACGGGSTKSNCTDSDPAGIADKRGDYRCKSYVESDCGQFDDSDFTSSDMCCICAGGKITLLYPPFDCTEGYLASWSVSKRDWCCKPYGGGVDCGINQRLRTTSTTTTTLFWMLNATARDEGIFNCTYGFWGTWIQEKRSFCCETAPPTALTAPARPRPPLRTRLRPPPSGQAAGNSARTVSGAPGPTGRGRSAATCSGR
ncbi:unnamed protein product [Prorocentrum cordatum]|uniref:Cellulase n=1 Tax=Prorocentrum cordatum TaxID=2364126 RepID=A0ABN9VJQ6_9DINO|nr:unnamed protein product [Polarella glacialis]